MCRGKKKTRALNRGQHEVVMWGHEEGNARLGRTCGTKGQEINKGETVFLAMNVGETVERRH